MGGVAIIRAAADHKIDVAILRSQAFKLNAGVRCLPDLIISGRGQTAAFLLYPLSSEQLQKEDLDRLCTAFCSKY